MWTKKIKATANPLTSARQKINKEYHGANKGNKHDQQALRSHYQVYLDEVANVQSELAAWRDDANIAVAAVSLLASEVDTEPPPKAVERAIQEFDAANRQFGPAFQRLQADNHGLSLSLDLVLASPWCA